MKHPFAFEHKRTYELSEAKHIINIIASKGVTSFLKNEILL